MQADVVALETLVELPNNPKLHAGKSISDSIAGYGYLQRITINRTTGHIIAGNGRLQALLAAHKRGDDPPNGIEIRQGQWFVPVDYVDVPAAKERVVSVILNKTTELGGWDNVLFLDTLAEMSVLDAAICQLQLDQVGEAEEEGEQPTVVERAVQLRPDQEYIVVVCATQEEFDHLKEVFSLGLVRRGGYAHGSQFDDVGTQRVIPASKLLERVYGAHSDTQ